MRKAILAFSLLSILFVAVCGLSSCSSSRTGDSNVTADKKTAVSSHPDKVEKPRFTRETYPKVDGSTATIPLSEAIASQLTGLKKEDVRKFVKHQTTHNAYENLIAGKADIIFVTEPSENELKLAGDLGLELEIVPVVKEGFVFLVNINNPVKSLTIKQIQEIYQGKIENWKDVGGRDFEIVPFQREQNSGSQTLMEQKVMKGLKMIEDPRNLIDNMGILIEKVAKYDNSNKAIGYSVYYYAKNMYNRSTIKFLAVNEVMPDDKTISSGRYPLTSAYYAVFRKSEQDNSAPRKLLNWLLSEEGQSVAEKAGYVRMEKR